VASSPTEALRIISAMPALPGLHVSPITLRAVVGWMDLLRRRDFEVFAELAVVKP
jgi:hypothetical protein